MIDGIVRKVNYMARATIPTSFDSLMAGQGSAHVYAKATQMYGSGIAKSIASTLLAHVMLVQLVRISQRTEAHATFPAVREVAPLLVSSLLCSVLVDVSTIISMVVVWGRGMQLYFMATMSPIPLALLGMDETRQMGVGFLRNYASLVLGYAALSFVVKLFPTLLQMSISTSFVMGGDGEMILSVTATCILQIILTVKCGSWAGDVPRIGRHGLHDSARLPDSCG